MAETDSGKTLSGTERAAILLLALGEDDASQILKHVDTDDVQKLGTAMAQIRNVKRNDVAVVLNHFVDAVEDETALAIGTDDTMRNMLVNAFGDNKGNALLDRILGERGQPGLEALRWMEPAAIADAIRNEHPQIIAIVLAYLEPAAAAEVIDAMPPETATDILLRIARLDDVQQSALKELEAIVVRQASLSGGKSTKVGGEKVAAGILNALGGSGEEMIMEQLNGIDEELGARIQDQMFVFEALMEVNDRGIQTLLREISSDTLSLALKGADSALQEKIFRNMSRRASQMLSEDMEARGPVRISDVEAAQKEILGVAKRLAEAGDIMLGGGDDYV